MIDFEGHLQGQGGELFSIGEVVNIFFVYCHHGLDYFIHCIATNMKTRTKMSSAGPAVSLPVLLCILVQ